MTTESENLTPDRVRERYALAATAATTGQAAAGCGASLTADADSCCSPASCAPESVDVDDTFGAGLYSAQEQGELPAAALAASLGCGNPIAVANLRPGETVLDLGSGGG